MSFEKLFFASKGQPIVYAGATLSLADYIEIKADTIIQVEIESANSEWKQGVSLVLDKGSFIINNKNWGKNIGLWKDTAPRIAEIKCIGVKTAKLKIYNMWDCGDGVIHSRHNGAAMKIEQNENERRYFCNDGHPDENFNDIVFRVSIDKFR